MITYKSYKPDSVLRTVMKHLRPLLEPDDWKTVVNGQMYSHGPWQVTKDEEGVQIHNSRLSFSERSTIEEGIALIGGFGYEL